MNGVIAAAGRYIKKPKKYIGGQTTDPSDIFFKDDGTKMYILSYDEKKVFQYSLSTPWEVTTITYDTVSFDISLQDTVPTGLFFKPDGTKMYISGNQTDSVYQYSLSIAWDISSASYDSVSYSVLAKTNDLDDIFFKPDGLKLYVLSGDSTFIYQYGLTVAWDISSLFPEDPRVPTVEQEGDSVFFKPDGSGLFMSRSFNSIIYYYKAFGTGNEWDLKYMGYDLVSKNVSTEDFVPVSIFFKPDGLSMYVLGEQKDTVFQYTLSVAWDLSTAIFNP